MSTALFDVAKGLDSRRLELDTLILQAERVEYENELLYKAICRACCVLLASHLEGLLKEATKAIVNDFNFHVASFSEMPAAMKRTFCERIAFYEGVKGDEINKRIGDLMAFFNKNTVPIEFNAFSYKENSNRNPSAKFLDVAFSRIGVPAVVSSLAGCPLERLFENDDAVEYIIFRDIRRMRSHLYHFPYRPLPPDFFIANAPARSDTLWHTLIEEVMERRHQIAHGDTMDSVAGHRELARDCRKVHGLMAGLIFSAATYMVRSKQ